MTFTYLIAALLVLSKFFFLQWECRMAVLSLEQIKKTVTTNRGITSTHVFQGQWIVKTIIIENHASNTFLKISHDLLFCFLIKYNAPTLLSVLGKTNCEVWVSSFNQQSDIKNKLGLKINLFELIENCVVHLISDYLSNIYIFWITVKRLTKYFVWKFYKPNRFSDDLSC